MSHHIVEDGLRKIVVDADTAYIYEASHLTDLREVRVVFFTAEGDTSSVVTGDRGLYRMQAGTMKATGPRGGADARRPRAAHRGD